LQWAGAIPIQSAIDVFEPMDQIDYFVSAVGASCRRAEVGATAEWARFVDETLSRFPMQQRTSTVGRFRQSFAAARAESFRGDKRFAFGQVGCSSGKIEMTTLG